MSWVRLWIDMPTDPKFRVIAKKAGRPLAEVISVFVTMMTNAGANANERSEQRNDRGELTNWSDEDVAAALDMEVEHVEAIRSAMQGKTLEGNKLKGWEKRQPKREDNSAERSKAWRERKRTQPTAEKRPDTDTDTDTDTEPEKTRDVRADDAPKRLRSQGSRLSNDFELPEDWRQWAKVNCLASDDQIDTEAANFADYWIAKPSQATSLDWKRTWQKWARKSFSPAGNRRPQSTGTYGSSPDKHQVEGISAMIARLKSEGAIQ